MTKKEFNEWLKTRSKSVQDINSLISSRMPDLTKSMDRKEVCQTQRNQEMGEKYQLCHIDVVFKAGHGKGMDQDNRRYIIKPIQDATINLGLSQDDSHITSEVTQRFNEADINI